MRTRSLAALGALALTGSLVLAGCGNSSSSSSGGGLSGGDASSSGGGDTNATYTIAFEGPLSGDNAQLGINEVNGVQLAIDQANESGDLGFKLELVKGDDQGTPDQAPTAAQSLIQDSAVLGVVGPSFSGATKAVATTYADNNIALMLLLLTPLPFWIGAKLARP